jgi:hypothetical protein
MCTHAIQAVPCSKLQLAKRSDELAKFGKDADIRWGCLNHLARLQNRITVKVHYAGPKLAGVAVGSVERMSATWRVPLIAKTLKVGYLWSGEIL